MTATTTNKTTFLDSAIPTLKRFFASPDEPAVLREDAGTAHRFVKKTGGIWVELNPVRERDCGDRFAVIRKARDEKIDGAGDVRERKLKEAKAAYDAAVASIEAEHRGIAATATSEFEQAEQALLCEFSAPPAPVPAA